MKFYLMVVSKYQSRRTKEASMGWSMFIHSGSVQTRLYCLRFSVLGDLMDHDTPEVWLGIDGFGRNKQPLLFCQLYREQFLAQGKYLQAKLR